MTPKATTVALILSAALGILGLWAPDAGAHRPQFSEPPAHATPETALQLPDIDVSRAIYRRAPDADPFWVRLSGKAGEPLRIQLGVPRIERLADFRPTVVLVGPELPQPEALPPSIDMPMEGGARVFATGGVEDPRVFHEEITGTASWVIVERSLRLPETGAYYIAVHSAESGRYWISTGSREAFGLADVAKLPAWTERVRAFHEVEGWPAWMTITTLIAVLLAMGGIWIGVRSL